MAELTLDRTYATALYEAAKEAGCDRQVAEDLDGILDTLNQNPEFKRFFAAPTISVEDKKATLRAIFEGHIQKETLHFLYILADKDRAGHFERMVRAYHRLMDEALGFVDGEVYSVTPLSEEQMAKLTETIGDRIGARVKLTNHIDRSLVGGLKVQVEGKLFDASFKSRLEAIKQAMKQEVIE